MMDIDSEEPPELVYLSNEEPGRIEVSQTPHQEGEEDATASPVPLTIITGLYAPSESTDSKL